MQQVGVGLMVFQQLSGCNGIGFYASQIFIYAGITSGDIGTILMGTIQVQKILIFFSLPFIPMNYNTISSFYIILHPWYVIHIHRFQLQ